MYTRLVYFLYEIKRIKLSNFIVKTLILKKNLFYSHWIHLDK